MTEVLASFCVNSTEARVILKDGISVEISQGVLHAVPPELLVVVDEGEGQGDVQGIRPVWRSGSFARLKGNH